MQRTPRAPHVRARRLGQIGRSKPPLALIAAAVSSSWVLGGAAPMVLECRQSGIWEWEGGIGVGGRGAEIPPGASQCGRVTGNQPIGYLRWSTAATLLQSTPHATTSRTARAEGRCKDGLVFLKYLHVRFGSTHGGAAVAWWALWRPGRASHRHALRSTPRFTAIPRATGPALSM